MFEKALILGLYSVTPVHAGSGAELSVIDLPIQRERHTGFPVIWGQSLKGVLRSYFRKLELNKDDGSKWIDSAWIYVAGKREDEFKDEREKKRAEESVKSYIEKVKQGKRDPPLTEIIFGPSIEAASEHAGAISVGDAKVLLFPVRSLKGVFAYVTCPLVLERFVEDINFMLKINDVDQNSMDKLVECVNDLRKLINTAKENKNKAIVFGDDVKVQRNGKAYVVLEDVLLEVVGNVENDKYKNPISLINQITPDEVDISKIDISKRLVIVDDNVFTAFVTTTTEIVARIQIDAKTGTVKTGALWYEEYLPADTLLYSVIAIGKPKVWGKNEGEREKNEEKIKKLFECKDLRNCIDKIAQHLNSLAGYLQVGGNETVGKGFVKATFWGGKI